MGGQLFKTTNVARFEIETDPIGLANLAQNPNGDLGGWAWVTPLASSTMSGPVAVSGANTLLYTKTNAGASYFTSELIPIAAAQYAAASLKQQAAGNAYHRIRFEWYDASKTLLSSSAQTALTAPALGAVTFVAPVVAPASTAYLKLRVDLYTSSGVDPTAANTFQFNQATISKATTSAALGSSRKNLIPNPNFAVNTTGWAALRTGNTISRTTAQQNTGAGALSLSRVGPGLDRIYAGTLTGTSGIPVVAGTTYTLSAYFRAATAARRGFVGIQWYNAAGTSISVSTTGMGADYTSTSWTRHAMTAVAPATAAFAQAYVGIDSDGAGNIPPLGEVHYVDSVLLEAAAAAGGFFDGASVLAGYTYAWTGTANQSASTEVYSNLAYNPPVSYINILGSAYKLEIDRDVLSASILTGSISDATLDPAVSTLIRPGRRCRFMASSDGGTTFTQVFGGKLADGSTVYELDKSPGGLLTVDITVQAVDAAAALSAQGESRGVGSIAELPYLLEGKGVPWNCNGSGSQVASAVQVSSNENASILDQLTITRDTVRGYAWVDRIGVVQAWDAASMPASTSATFSDSAGLSYSDIDVDWSLDTCINSVTVKWLRYNPATGETAEITYGPYVDQTSIDTWGPHSAEYTIHGATESSTTIAAYAAAILAANGTPAVRCNSLKMPVRTASEIGYAATLDLYSKIHVNFATKVNADYRITSIKHTIEPNKWMVSYEFDATTSVAQPITTPSPPNDTINDGVWITPTKTNGWLDWGGSERIIQYMRKNGIVYIEGAGKTGTINQPAFTLPPGYRPSNIVRGATDSNNAYGEVAVLSTGAVYPAVGSNVRFNFHIAFPAEL